MTEQAEDLTGYESTAGRVALALMPFGLVIAQVAIQAWAVGCLWTWFVTPTLGVPEPSYGHLYGLVILVALLTSKGRHTAQSLEQSRAVTTKLMMLNAATRGLGALTCVALGYLVHAVIS